MVLKVYPNRLLNMPPIYTAPLMASEASTACDSGWWVEFGIRCCGRELGVGDGVVGGGLDRGDENGG